MKRRSAVDAMGGVGTVALLAAMFVVGVLLTRLAWIDLRAIMNATTVAGVVSQTTRLGPVGHAMGRRGTVTCHDARVTYTFSVGGESYVGEGTLSVPETEGGKALFDTLVTGFPVGGEVTVVVDPQRPSRSWLANEPRVLSDKPTSSGAALLGALGLLALLVPICVLLVAVSVVRASRFTESDD